MNIYAFLGTFNDTEFNDKFGLVHKTRKRGELIAHKSDVVPSLNQLVIGWLAYQVLC